MPTKNIKKNQARTIKPADKGKQAMIEAARVTVGDLQARGLDRAGVYDELRLRYPKLPKEHCKTLAGYSRGYSTTIIEQQREARFLALPLPEQRKRLQQSQGLSLSDNVRPLAEIRDSKTEAGRDRVAASRVIGEQMGFNVKDNELPTVGGDLHQAVTIIQQLNVSPAVLQSLSQVSPQ